MPPKRRSKRRSKSTPTSKRAKSRKRRPPPKRKPAHKPKRKPKRRAAKVKKRSAAATKGWEQRRKKYRLINAMAEHRADRQPIGWIERRAEVREIDGELWRRIAVEYSEDARKAAHLATLEELEIDLLTKGELYDYLSWIAEEYEIEISDMYRMYLGYQGEAAE